MDRREGKGRTEERTEGRREEGSRDAGTQTGWERGRDKERERERGEGERKRERERGREREREREREGEREREREREGGEREGGGGQRDWHLFYTTHTPQPSVGNSMVVQLNTYETTLENCVTVPARWKQHPSVLWRLLLLKDLHHLCCVLTPTQRATQSPVLSVNIVHNVMTSVLVTGGASAAMSDKACPGDWWSQCCNVWQGLSRWLVEPLLQCLTRLVPCDWWSQCCNVWQGLSPVTGGASAAMSDKACPLWLVEPVLQCLTRLVPCDWWSQCCNVWQGLSPVTGGASAAMSDKACPLWLVEPVLQCLARLVPCDWWSQCCNVWQGLSPVTGGASAAMSGKACPLWLVEPVLQCLARLVPCDWWSQCCNVWQGLSPSSRLLCVIQSERRARIVTRSSPREEGWRWPLTTSERSQISFIWTITPS